MTLCARNDGIGMKNFITTFIQNSNDRIIYFWLLLFILPIPIAIFIDSTSIRNFNYVWAFLFLVYFFKNKIISHTSNIVFSPMALRVFFCGVLISFNYSALAQYYNFQASGLDFSIFDNMLQEALRGNWGYSTIVGFYHFATHQNYILLLILPIYYILPYPVILPIILMTSLWLAGILLWKISRLWLCQFWSFILVLSFYLSPHLQVGATCFSPEMFYPCLFFLVAYAYIKNINILFILSVFLFFSVKEEAILYGVGFALWLLINKNYSKMFVVLFLIAIFATANFLIIGPYFLTKSHLIMSPPLGFWSDYGHTKTAIIMYIIHHPLSVILHMFNYSSGFWSIYPTFLFIPLLSLPVVLISAIPLALNLSAVDNTSGLHILNGYYPAVLICLCFIGMLCFIIKYKHKTQHILAILTLITSPLWGSGAQGFYHINVRHINDFNQVKTILKTKYTDSKICPAGAIYPHIRISDFKYLGTVGKENAEGFMMQKNCIVVFSEFGDNFPYTTFIPHMVKYAKSHDKCNHIGGIYYCNNYEQTP